jgi:hypothetical protein
LLLQEKKVVAIVPPSQPSEDSWDEALPVEPVMAPWARVVLIAVAVGLAAVFAVAIYLDPYQDNGQARRMETHRQLGLPECTFKEKTGLPCPSCGMTTSFALMVRGDVWNAVQANSAGAVLAAICMLVIPWSIACTLLGRFVLVRSVEWTLTRLVVAFFVFMLLRWGVVLLVQHLGW